MPDEIVVTPVVPAVPAEPTFDEQLAAAMAPPAAELAVEPPAVTPETPAEPTIEDKLKEIEGTPDPTPEVKAPELSADQTEILAAIPDVATARRLTESASNHQRFSETFEKGDFAAVEQMFQNWRPDVYEKFVNHVVTRWIEEEELKQGNPAVGREVNGLKAQLAQMQAQLQGRSQQEQTASQQAAQQAAYTGYTTTVNGWFDKIQTPEADRRYILSDLKDRINASPTVAQAIMAGKPAAARSLFAQAVRDYNQRDQAAAAVKAGALTAQEIKKPLLQAGAQQEALPTDWNEIPKEKREQAFDEQLGAIYAKAAKKGR